MNVLPLVVFFISHLLGDFYLQSESLSQKKARNYLYTLQHTGIYSVVMVFFGCLLLLLNYNLSWLAWGLLIVSHVIIDLGKCGLNRSKLISSHNDKWVYIVDQVAHSFFIVGASFFVSGNGLPENYQEVTLFLTKLVLFGLLLFKPTNITFKVVFSKYQYEGADQLLKNDKEIKLASTVAGAGAVIGNLERIIMGIFLMLNQYGAIGLILTAKSITRYNKIATNPAFSEYYLIGTLYSLLATLLPYLVLFHVSF